MDESSATVVRYERRGGLLRLTLRGLTNHELREVLVGLWSRLDAGDRADHIAELTHYHTDPASWLSPVARAIKDGPDGESAIDIDAMVRAEHGRPPR